jgi:hypothetical protein
MRDGACGHLDGVDCNDPGMLAKLLSDHAKLDSVEALLRNPQASARAHLVRHISDGHYGFTSLF